MKEELEFVFTVSELTRSIKRLLEQNYPFLSIRGEVSNVRQQSSGHLYFTLKDQQAQIAVVMFANQAKGLSRIPRDGDALVVHGELSVYSLRGQYQIIACSLEHSGLGALLVELEERKARLAARGWFDTDKKKRLPAQPKYIGVITSPSGSVIQDILQVLRRRLRNFRVLINPVLVQGNEAAGQIAQAIDQMNQHMLADVLIVARGGGSMEDLWPFNEEVVVEAVFLSHIPVISAVGHETDTTLIDYAADVRAPTPSVAAELVAEATDAQEQRLHKCIQGLVSSWSYHWRGLVARLEVLVERHRSKTAQQMFSTSWQSLDEMSQRIKEKRDSRLDKKKLKLNQQRILVREKIPSHKILSSREKIEQLRKMIEIIAKQKCQEWRGKIRHTRGMPARRQVDRVRFGLQMLEKQVQLVEPDRVFARGYCRLDEDRDISDVQVKEKVWIITHKYKLKAQVLQKVLHDTAAI